MKNGSFSSTMMDGFIRHFFPSSPLGSVPLHICGLCVFAVILVGALNIWELFSTNISLDKFNDFLL